MFEDGGLLRRVLAFDAATCAAMGAGLVAGAEPVAAVTGLPAAALPGVGAALVGFAGVLGWLATRATVPEGPVRAVVAGNLAWSVASVALVASGAVALTGLGQAAVLAQAAAVVVIAELEVLGLRRERVAAT
ncbi:hypothetical protein [Sphingomonas lenta]|uniref:Integral membrane protein n=1 Tax=Sphingomonas lenta TaxID=1141887 RepID=A0A2A2SBJ0_9SPHN|nr:hypothetical protein [Sphingomonas lenta]PAX06583.1 hypothetical protein CKY28_15635 [Sphingomonas lenta]